ncbi:30S ribosomal protein S9 [Cryomorphaceae bacterium]|nr:30S ribosomal protein S9 [Cryomorphaceae bacterium]
MEITHALGRRKKSIARVYLSEGKGNFTINNRAIEDYFPTPTLRYKVMQPFTIADIVGKYDVKANIEGGGTTGQAEALRLGIARALCEINEEYRALFKPHSLLTRDPRMVERKKFGQKKARKKFQFSKR